MVPLTMQLSDIQWTLFPNYFNNSLTQKALKEIFCDMWPCYTGCILYGWSIGTYIIFLFLVPYGSLYFPLCFVVIKALV